MCHVLAFQRGASAASNQSKPRASGLQGELAPAPVRAAWTRPGCAAIQRQVETAPAECRAGTSVPAGSTGTLDSVLARVVTEPLMWGRASALQIGTREQA